MAPPSVLDQAMRLLARALSAGAVVEIGDAALVDVAEPGPVVPLDRSGTWPGFVADAPGLFACCLLLPHLPAALLPPATRGWLRLGEADELPELLPVIEWLAAMNEAGLRSFVLGLLHGLNRIADAPVASAGLSRPVVRAPVNLAREFLG